MISENHDVILIKSHCDLYFSSAETQLFLRRDATFPPQRRKFISAEEEIFLRRDRCIYQGELALATPQPADSGRRTEDKDDAEGCVDVAEETADVRVLAVGMHPAEEVVHPKEGH